MDKNKKKRVYIIAAALALVFVCFFIIININGIIKAAAPETYLKMALLNTYKNISASAKGYNTPLEQKFNLEIKDIGGNLGEEYNQLLNSVKLELTAQRDLSAREVNINFSALSDSFELADSRLYTSPSVAAVRLPYLYGGQYITADLGAFREDLDRILDKLTGSLVFTDGGKAEISLNKQNISLDKMTYIIPASAANKIYQDIIEIAKKQNGGKFDFLDKVVITDDLAVNFYINKKRQVVKAELEALKISVYSERYNTDVTGVFNFYIELFGDKKLSDGINAAINVKSGTDDYTVIYAGKSDDSKDGVKKNYGLSLKNGNVVIAKILIDTAFTPDSGPENNYKADITLNVGFNQATADITGRLAETAIESVDKPDIGDSIDFFNIWK